MLAQGFHRREAVWREHDPMAELAENGSDHDPVHRVVLRHQDGQGPAGDGRAVRCRPHRVGLLDRGREAEGRALSGVARDLDRSTRLLDGGLHQGQAEPGAAGALPACELRIGLEDAGKVMGRDAGTRIPHLDRQPSFAGHRRRHGDLSGLRVLDRVVDEVLDGTPQRDGVPDEALREAGERSRERQAAGLGAGTGQPADRTDDLGGRKPFLRAEAQIGLEPPEIENVVGHSDELGDGILEQRQVIAHGPPGRGACRQDIDDGRCPGKGRADLMRGRPQATTHHRELGLRGIELVDRGGNGWLDGHIEIFPSDESLATVSTDLAHRIFHRVSKLG